MEIYNIESEGVNFTFHARKNTTKPCPSCGIPACGNETILWFEAEGKRISLIFDGMNFDCILDDFLKENKHQIDYKKLPDFIREWNEEIGWKNCTDYNGYNLDIDDFTTSLKLILTTSYHEKWIPKKEIHDMEMLALEAKSKNKTLKIVCG